jgi:hypothetical protein
MNAETSHELRRLAEECRVRAELSQSSAQEQWWLEMAANWTAMADERGRDEVGPTHDQRDVLAAE